MTVLIFIAIGLALGWGAGESIGLGALSLIPALLGGLMGFWLEAFLLHNAEGRAYRAGHRDR